MDKRRLDDLLEYTHYARRRLTGLRGGAGIEHTAAYKMHPEDVRLLLQSDRTEHGGVVSFDASGDLRLFGILVLADYRRREFRPYLHPTTGEGRR